MQVVNLDDTWLRGHGFSYVTRIESLRSCLQENAPRFFHQAITGTNHKHCYEERSKGIQAVDAGEEYGSAGYRRCDKGEEIVEDVLEATLDIEALTVSLAEHPGCEHVHDYANQRNTKNEAALHLGR